MPRKTATKRVPRGEYREFVGAVKEFEEKADNPTLTEYLENVSLVSDLDEMGEDGGAVTMMTLHSAKGLEFPNVFMVGMEENLFPSARSRDDESRMEEERRLCYVGITRARERLFMSHASRRMLYNQIQFNDRSRFIDDIPARLIEDVSVSGGMGGRRKTSGRRLAERRLASACMEQEQRFRRTAVGFVCLYIRVEAEDELQYI